MTAARRLRFWKMSGAGNDFVLVDGADVARLSGSKAALARRLCDRKNGVGADGLLIVLGKAGLRPGARRPSLRYFNADGSAAFCGNGTRCAAAWLLERGAAAGPQLELDTIAGPVRARAAGRGRMAVRMPQPSEVRAAQALEAAGRRWRVHHVDTGVPHAVVFVDDVERVDVAGAGRALRRHPAFAPAGANVDFVERGRGALRLRTYERGVEAETLACGTGAAAAAVVAASLGLARPPVRLRVRGGAQLVARFRLDKDLARELWLEGPAETVFQGEFPL